jgi:hypothetical protein
MRKTLLFALILFTSVAYAQTDVSAYYGWQFGSKMTDYYGQLKLKAAPNYGAIVEFGVRPDLMIQLQYMGSQTKATYQNYNSFIGESTDVGINYYQVGVIRPFPVNEKVEFFGSFSAGATQFHVQQFGYNDEWRFSITLGLGTKIWLTDVIGIRLQSRLLAPINWAGLGFYCGTGGCGSGVNAGSTFISGDVSGGLVFRLQ